MRGGGYGVIIRPLVNFAVGMFIFLSGYLTKENENGVYRDIIYRRIKKIIVPYIIWSFIFAIVNRRINTFIPDVFMSKCNGIYYFILVYIQMVLLIPVTFKLLRSRFSKLGWFVTPVSIFLIRYISLWFNIELGFPFQGELFVFWFGFYYLGVSLKNGYINLQLSPKCLTNLCLFSLVIQGVEGFIWYWMGNFDMATTQLKMSSIITTGLFCISAYIYIEAGDLNLNEQPVVLKKFLKVLGDNSFGIYLCHMLIIRILNKLVPMANIFPINAIFVIMISTVCVMMAHRILGKHACQRLKVQDFWTKVLGVYYSVFTALLAIIGVKEGAEFLTLPSACFTVAVALIVCATNAQNFAGRAHDLEVNVEDLKSLEDEIKIGKLDGENGHIDGYKKYRKKCRDSEEEGILDRYKYYGYKCYKYIVYRSTNNTLMSEKRQYVTSKGIYKNANDPCEILVERVESIIDDEAHKWVATFKETKEDA